jgi:hypothetical protein
MWKIFRNKITLTVSVLIGAHCLALTGAYAEETFQLPGVALAQGSDEVRAADGTSCRSSLGSDGAYVDMGMIGKKNQFNQDNDGAYYGRVVVPLGKASKRLDCSQLYSLEVERLKLELELAKAGLGRQEDASIDQRTSLNESANSNWMNEGWSTDGRQKNDH